jgi:hypothetical protein
MALVGGFDGVLVELASDVIDGDEGVSFLVGIDSDDGHFGRPPSWEVRTALRIPGQAGHRPNKLARHLRARLLGDR